MNEDTQGTVTLNDDSIQQHRTLVIPTLQHEDVPVALDDLATDQLTLEDVQALLVGERVEVKFWVRIIEEIWRLGRWKDALALLDKGIESEHISHRESAQPCVLY